MATGKTSKFVEVPTAQGMHRAGSGAFLHGHGAQAPKHPIHMSNGHTAPRFTVSKDSAGNLELREMVQPGVYRTLAVSVVEMRIARKQIGWDVAKLIMDFPRFVDLRGGYPIDTAKFEKPA